MQTMGCTRDLSPEEKVSRYTIIRSAHPKDADLLLDLIRELAAFQGHEGDVQATIESGTLTISETGDVRGEATVDAAEINGKFDGTLTVKKCLTINSSGRVTGTVHYGELKVEQGGQVSGEIRAQSAEDASDKPRLASAGGKDENKSGDSSTSGQGNSSSRSSKNCLRLRHGSAPINGRMRYGIGNNAGVIF